MPARIVVIGAGIGGLTSGALLAQAGYDVTVLESQIYLGGCAGTFTHRGYRFDAGATVVGGFHANGPHTLVGQQLGITWPICPTERAWVVHLPNRTMTLTRDRADVIEQFPHSKRFWEEQACVADLCWTMAAQGLPWPPTNFAELVQLADTGTANFPADLRLLPLLFTTVEQWLAKHGLTNDAAFLRFVDAQLLISAQTTAQHANAIYGATALDLARQGVYHVIGGIGELAQVLATKIRDCGGQVLFRQPVREVKVENRRVSGVYAQAGKHSTTRQFFPCDFLIANLTPWSLHHLLGENSPPLLQREVRQRQKGWGAFSIYLGVAADRLPHAIADHHQIVTASAGPLGEGRSIFVSLSPAWDATRAPVGHRAAGVTTHTAVLPWWDLLGIAAYEERKKAYTEHILNAVDAQLPGFRRSIVLSLPGTPVTYNYYTGRYLGMVGGFPQTSLFSARSPRTGIRNLLLVGDSIFPGQSTAGVTLGALRVAQAVQYLLVGMPQPG
jgi:C-3',4' desaturase CrtD